MKKTVLIVAAIVGLMAVFACKTQPPAPAPVLSAEDDLRAVYNQYRGDLILDGAETYTVVEGDTLNHIARTHYHGDGFDYPLILLASSDVVVDEDKLSPGMELTIPDLQKNLEDPTANAMFKAVLLAVADIEDERNRDETAQGLRNKADSL